MEHENDSDTNCNWCTRNNYSIIKIGQNAKKILGDLKRLAVTQTPVKESSVKNSQLVKEEEEKED